MQLYADKMALRYIGEVALREKHPSGVGYINKIVKKIDETNIPRHFIININNYGTGFVLRKLNHPIFIKPFNQYALGLVVTASHVVSDVLQMNGIRIFYQCQIDGYSEDYNLFFIKMYNTKYFGDAIGSNGASYCAGEGDFALLLLL